MEADGSLKKEETPREVAPSLDQDPRGPQDRLLGVPAFLDGGFMEA